MHKQKKNVVAFLLALVLVFLVLPTHAAAAQCEHVYKYDVCKKCNHLRTHDFTSAITFYTAKDNVPVWSQPTKNSTKVRTISQKDVRIDLGCILRNQYGNIWFKLYGENAYVYIDNVYLDFMTLCVQNYQKITARDDVAMQALEFYNLVKPEGAADYKEWLDPGGKNIPYSVKINGSFYNMTAEELGNIHFGFLGRAVGFSDKALLYGGGTVNVVGLIGRIPSKSITFTCADGSIQSFSPICVQNTLTEALANTAYQIYTECSGSYCDNVADTSAVQKGIDYYDTGDFSW